MRLALIGNGIVHAVGMFGHISMVSQHEAAFHDVVAGHLGEAAVLAGQFEPLYRLIEIPLHIVDVAKGISGRHGIIR